MKAEMLSSPLVFVTRCVDLVMTAGKESPIGFCANRITFSRKRLWSSSFLATGTGRILTFSHSHLPNFIYKKKVLHFRTFGPKAQESSQEMSSV